MNVNASFAWPTATITVLLLWRWHASRAPTQEEAKGTATGGDPAKKIKNKNTHEVHGSSEHASVNPKRRVVVNPFERAR